MMKAATILILLLLLAGCATERHYPDYYADGRDAYYYPDLRLDYARGYGHDRLFLYGVYPWWTYDFYSPYFYPYRYTYYHPFYDPFYGRYFYAGWSTAWPYYGGYYGRYGWAAVPYRQPPVSPSGHDRPGGPVSGGALIGDERRRRFLDQRSYARELMYSRPSTQQRGTLKPSQGVVAPATKVAPYGSTKRTYGGPKATGLAVPRSRPAVSVPRASIPNASPRTDRFDGSGADRARAHRDR